MWVSARALSRHSQVLSSIFCTTHTPVHTLLRNHTPRTPEHTLPGHHTDVNILLGNHIHTSARTAREPHVSAYTTLETTSLPAILSYFFLATSTPDSHFSLQSRFMPLGFSVGYDKLFDSRLHSCLGSTGHIPLDRKEHWAQSFVPLK